MDAALGAQTRPHDDLDLIVELRAVGRLQGALEERGYTVARGGPPKSFELTDREGRQVDVHPVAFDDSGDGVYRLEDGEDWVYPAAGFEGTGSILGRRVRCLTPEVQLLCHSGYEPHRTSFDDVHALCERFSPRSGRVPRQPGGLPAPSRVAAYADSSASTSCSSTEPALVTSVGFWPFVIVSFVITHLETSLRDGSSNITSSSAVSMIERRPRAPVSRSSAFCEISQSASSVKTSSMLS